MSIILALGLPLLLACFIAGFGVAPCKSKCDHKEKWEEEYTLLRDE